MRIYYRTLLIFSLLLNTQTAAFATSKLYTTEATVVIKENRPCVFIKKDEYPDDKAFVTGISLYVRDLKEPLWEASIIVPDSAIDCLPLGDEDIVFRTPKLYYLKIGNAGGKRYARADFCLGKDGKGNYFFSKGGNGVCTNEPEAPPKPKTWWQKWFD